MSLRKYYLALLNLFFPHRCLSCRTDLPFDEPRHLCPRCLEAVLPVPEPLCVQCGAHLPGGRERCEHCKKGEMPIAMVRSSARFEGPIRDLIHHFKYHGKDYLFRELTDLLVTSWNKYPELQEPDVIVPVPLHPAGLRERGYNQSALLAKELVSRLNREQPGTKRTLSHALIRAKNTPSQTTLSREERVQNLRSAFLINDGQDVRGRSVLLIDDVCTSASTLNECARALRNAGASQVFGLTLARD